MLLTLALLAKLPISKLLSSSAIIIPIFQLPFLFQIGNPLIPTAMMNRKLCKASTTKDFSVSFLGKVYIINATSREQAARKFQHLYSVDVANFIFSKLNITQL